MTPYMLIVLFTAGFVSGWWVQGWKEDARTKHAVETAIEEHNHVIHTLSQAVREVEVTKIEYRDKIIKIPAPVLDSDCPIPELTRLRNEAYSALDSSLFHGAN